MDLALQRKRKVIIDDVGNPLHQHSRLARAVDKDKDAKQVERVGNYAAQKAGEKVAGEESDEETAALSFSFLELFQTFGFSIHALQVCAIFISISLDLLPDLWLRLFGWIVFFELPFDLWMPMNNQTAKWVSLYVTLYLPVAIFHWKNSLDQRQRPKGNKETWKDGMKIDMDYVNKRARTISGINWQSFSFWYGPSIFLCCFIYANLQIGVVLRDELFKLATLVTAAEAILIIASVMYLNRRNSKYGFSTAMKENSEDDSDSPRCCPPLPRNLAFGGCVGALTGACVGAFAIGAGAGSGLWIGGFAGMIVGTSVGVCVGVLIPKKGLLQKPPYLLFGNFANAFFLSMNALALASVGNTEGIAAPTSLSVLVCGVLLGCGALSHWVVIRIYNLYKDNNFYDPQCEFHGPLAFWLQLNEQIAQVWLVFATAFYLPALRPIVQELRAGIGSCNVDTAINTHTSTAICAILLVPYMLSIPAYMRAKLQQKDEVVLQVLVQREGRNKGNERYIEQAKTSSHQEPGSSLSEVVDSAHYTLLQNFKKGYWWVHLVILMEKAALVLAVELPCAPKFGLWAGGAVNLIAFIVILAVHPHQKGKDLFLDVALRASNITIIVIALLRSYNAISELLAAQILVPVSLWGGAVFFWTVSPKRVVRGAKAAIAKLKAQGEIADFLKGRGRGVGQLEEEEVKEFLGNPKDFCRELTLEQAEKLLDAHGEVVFNFEAPKAIEALLDNMKIAPLAYRYKREQIELNESTQNMDMWALALLLTSDLYNQDQGVTVKPDHPRGIVLQKIAKKYKASELKKAGFTAAEMCKEKYSASELCPAGQQLYSAREMKVAGYNAGEMRKAGYKVQQMMGAGYKVQQMKEGGYSAREMKAAEISAQQLKQGEYTAQEMKEGGYSAQEMRGVGFDVKTLRREAGYSAAEMHQGGFTAKEMKECEYSAAELTKAGYSIEDLKEGGFNAKALKESGYSAQEMRGVGFDVKTLRREAGYSAVEMHQGGFTAKEMKECEYSAAELTKAGYSIEDLKKGGFNAKALKESGYSAQEMRGVGFAVKTLRQGGYDTAQIKEAGCSAREMKDNGFTAYRLRNRGYTAVMLRDGGFTTKELVDAEYSASEMKEAGFTAKQLRFCLSLRSYGAKELKEAGYSLENLKEARFRIGELKIGTFTAAELRDGGFTTKQLADAEYSVSEMKEAGYDPKELKKLKKYSATDMQRAGYGASEMREAKFGAKTLREAGYSAREMADAGFSTKQLKQAEYKAAQFREAGCSADELKCVGFTIDEVKEGGFSALDCHTNGWSLKDLTRAQYNATEMKEAGFTAQQLRKQKYGAAEMVKARYSIEDLKEGGFTPRSLKEGRCSASDMKKAGFGAKQLREGGYDTAQIKEAGCSAREMKDNGFTAYRLRNRGYAAAELRDGGFTTKQLADAEYSVSEMKEAGYDPKELKKLKKYSATDMQRAGYGASEMREAKFGAKTLREAGYSAREMADAGFSTKQLKRAGYSLYTGWDKPQMGPGLI